jgi:site-specific recombinase XerC
MSDKLAAGNTKRPPKRVTPIGLSELRRMVEALPNSPKVTRDRALLLLGFAAGLRRSELVAVNVEDVEIIGDLGLIVSLRRSKKPGDARAIGIPYGRESCPVRAVQDWIKTSGIKGGPLFRPVDQAGTVSDRRISDRSVARIVQRAARRAGLNPAQFAGDSLRAGLAAAAAQAPPPFEQHDWKEVST